MIHHYSRSCSVQDHNRANAPCYSKTLTPLVALLCALRQKWIMEERPNHAQSAQLLMAHHAWFWHAAIQPNNICDMCVQGRGNKAISEVIWAESVMVQWQCFVLVVREKTVRQVNESERTTSGRQHKYCNTELILLRRWAKTLLRLLCHAPRHILCTCHGRDFTTCSIFACDWVVCNFKQYLEILW